jgi:hypothetical protein
MNNIGFLEKKYVIKYARDDLKKMRPLNKVKYGGGMNLDLGYMLDNIASDYNIKINIINNEIVIFPREGVTSRANQSH